MMRPFLLKSILEALVLLALGSLIGFGFQAELIRQLFEGQPVHLPQQHGQTYPMPVMLEEIGPMLADGAMLMDARSSELFAHEHIPQALSFPLEEMESWQEQFVRAVAINRPLIIYCSGYGCVDSFDMATALISVGFGAVYVFEEGLPRWIDEGLPLESVNMDEGGGL